MKLRIELSPTADNTTACRPWLNIFQTVRYENGDPCLDHDAFDKAEDQDYSFGLFGNLKFLSNRSQFRGASVVLQKDAQSAVCELMGDEWYILPSSIHEVLIMPTEICTPWNLLDVVYDVNHISGTVTNEDFLADAVYKYSNGEITLVAERR